MKKASRKKAIHRKTIHKKASKKQSDDLSRFDLLKIIEAKSYFELSSFERKQVRKLFGHPIDAYSFIPHPDIISELTSEKGLERYIFIIETIRSDIYFQIKEFLSDRRVNVNTYFTGGTADFICDAYFTKDSYENFSNSIYTLFKTVSAKATSNPDEYITTYKIERPIILGGKLLSQFPKPSKETVKSIKNDLTSFEIALNNYRSTEAKDHFKTPAKVKKYLEKLISEHAIVGFKIVSDFVSKIDRQYVLLGQANDPIGSILKQANGVKKNFVRPISALFKAHLERGGDEADEKVHHISINDYDSPGERLIWRNALYEYDKGNPVNLFYYPIEGTLNESSLILSDLPEVLQRAIKYQGKPINIGHLAHISLPASANHVVGISKNALMFQGLTLGDSGTGKTTTDVVLLLNVINHLESVIVLDSSGSIKGKKELLKKHLDANTFVRIPDNSDAKQIETIFKNAITQKGLRVLEMDSKIYPLILRTICKLFEYFDDNTKELEQRFIKSFLLLEEIQFAFGAVEEKAQNIEEFAKAISIASRKGWCLWASTQAPTTFGDPSSVEKIMGILHNKIMHKISIENDVRTIVNSLSQASKEEKEFVEQNLLKPLQNCAIVIGTETFDGITCNPLSPIMVKIQRP